MGWLVGTFGKIALRKSNGTCVLCYVKLSFVSILDCTLSDKPDKPDYPYVNTPAHFIIPQPDTPSPITDPESLQKGLLVKNELMYYFWTL